jgi:hypothetical protein
MFEEIDTAQTKQQSQPHEKKLQQLISATPNLIYLRDGEVVLYKRSSTPIYAKDWKASATI